MAGEKTEKPTPKRREEARKKGQVARSADVNGAMVLAATLAALVAFGPRLFEELRIAMQRTLELISTPDVVSLHSLSTLLFANAKSVAIAVVPIAAVALVAGVGSAVAQVKWKPSVKIVKPDPKRISPLNGAKNLFGPNAVFEGIKGVLKVSTVGAAAAVAVIPEIEEVAALVGVPPEALAGRLADTVLDISIRAVAAYLVIAAIDYAWQRHRTEKSLKMDKQEVKDEMKQQAPPAEVRGAIRRRQLQAARARMMAAVPQADVVVTNPTRYAVALGYDGTKPAPEVLAKGKDLIAAQIRRIAEEHDVPIVPDAPLARSLHDSVEVGQQIPETLYAAVAQLLAFVYRVSRRSVA
jgi:flagellar biosynthetic protein FlhB